MRIAMVGTRGVPARYGGFETAVEEIGRRLVAAGHEVTVYCRSDGASESSTHLGMSRVVLPALRRKSIETLSHTFLSALHALTRSSADVVFLFNAANAPLVPLLRRRRTPVAIHMDGLESRRSKWGSVGRRYYRVAEAVSVRWGDALVADAEAIADYFAQEFGATTEMIPYGAPLIDGLAAEALQEFGVDPGRYHLAVARFEPENHIELIVRGYRRSRASWPLIVVGGAPYAKGYVGDVAAAAVGDDRIRLVGPVWNQDLLNHLYHHAATYLHGHSVGGTNPSLLRAMGAGAAVLAYDVVFAREVLGDTGWFFADEASLAELVEASEADPGAARQRGANSRRRAAAAYRWDDVGLAYEQLAERLCSGWSRRHEVSGRRRSASSWADQRVPSAVSPSQPTNSRQAND